MSAPQTSRGEPRLREVAVVPVDADDALGAAALHLEGVEAGVAADVEHRRAGRDPPESRARTAAT